MNSLVRQTILALRTLSEKLRQRLPHVDKQNMTNHDKDLVEYLEIEVPAIIVVWETQPVPDLHITKEEFDMFCIRMVGSGVAGEHFFEEAKAKFWAALNGEK